MRSGGFASLADCFLKEFTFRHLYPATAAGFYSLYINNKGRHGAKDERGAKLRDKPSEYKGNEELWPGLWRVTSRGFGVTWGRQD